MSEVPIGILKETDRVINLATASKTDGNNNWIIS